MRLLCRLWGETRMPKTVSSAALAVSSQPCSCGASPAWDTASGPRCLQCLSKGQRKRNKYNAVRTNGFDSAKEERRYRELVPMERGGYIHDLECQVPYVLSGKHKAVIDFRYRDLADNVVLEDAKGIDRHSGKPVTLTAAARAKYAWLKEKYGLEVRIV